MATKKRDAVFSDVDFEINDHEVGCCGIMAVLSWFCPLYDGQYEDDWNDEYDEEDETTIVWTRLKPEFYKEAQKRWTGILKDNRVAMLVASTAVGDGHSQAIVEKILRNSGWKLVGNSISPKTSRRIKLWRFQ